MCNDDCSKLGQIGAICITGWLSIITLGEAGIRWVNVNNQSPSTDELVLDE